MMNHICNKSVLIIEDDRRMASALEKVLVGEGAVVSRADWGGDAIGIMKERDRRIDLLITDLRMPFVSGLTVVFAVHRAYPELPIIVLTAFGSPVVKAECIRQGATAFLEKPLDTPHLLEEIEKIFVSQKAGIAASPKANGSEDFPKTKSVSDEDGNGERNECL